MKRRFASACLLILAAQAHAAPSLQDQISAIHQAELNQQAAERAAAQARQAELDRAAQARAAEQRRAEQARAAQIKKAEQQRAAVAAEAYSDKKRDQAYEDELRQLEIEERKLKLTALKAKTNRTDDYIDQELKQKAAETEVIQSQADATRNLSEGGKDLLKSEGQAREKEASSWFK
ncbi:hypothetical protein HMPREF1487_06384 [Pseudomonas sp. HPB0071]|uniref:DUF5384 family protein n=1 Tax=Pseudomonas luteola TaxID=47886 RepID=A0A2X2CYI6_PSELU|nr:MULTISPECIES: DUF5384 family protein [Pseudomonas]MBF8642081.1 DUF5384 family protein [Pseudomonas zeshuii]ENA32662.1 hypothetical protein HMPREF1487_06384 [Pseudomonas sp. HPB0071]RRW42828.1 hypothetical protein EGJ50_19705 [Pseudomonas luteola]SHJ09580.1 hypothetical protein SAMN05216295_107165 [Pseudomonas zeshuii]SPZ13118.1 Uncharacterised protein [Pseudomonas luteola]